MSSRRKSSLTLEKKSVFIRKLFSMLEDTQLSHLIWWAGNIGDSGFNFRPNIHFARALKRYFKHENISSFVRQLHMYEFRKVTEAGGFDEQGPLYHFRHTGDHFRRGDEASLALIKRRKQIAIKNRTAESSKQHFSSTGIPGSNGSVRPPNYAGQSHEYFSSPSYYPMAQTGQPQLVKSHSSPAYYYAVAPRGTLPQIFQQPQLPHTIQGRRMYAQDSAAAYAQANDLRSGHSWGQPMPSSPSHTQEHQSPGYGYSNQSQPVFAYPNSVYPSQGLAHHPVFRPEGASANSFSHPPVVHPANAYGVSMVVPGDMNHPSRSLQMVSPLSPYRVEPLASPAIKSQAPSRVTESISQSNSTEMRYGGISQVTTSGFSPDSNRSNISSLLCESAEGKQRANGAKPHFSTGNAIY